MPERRLLQRFGAGAGGAAASRAAVVGGATAAGGVTAWGTGAQRWAESRQLPSPPLEDRSESVPRPRYSAATRAAIPPTGVTVAAIDTTRDTTPRMPAFLPLPSIRISDSMSAPPVESVEIGHKWYIYYSNVGEGAGGFVCSFLREGVNSPLHPFHVAIKFASGGERGGGYFLAQEVGLLARLQHPHIIRVVGEVSDEDAAYLRDRGFSCAVLEYCGGGDLNGAASVESFSANTIVMIMVQILFGVEYMHFRKIAHRDLKSNNILIDDTGNVRLCDLGVARPFEGADEADATIVGTTQYMAPEVLRAVLLGAGAGAYDLAAADMWALGVVMFWLITGEVPYDATVFWSSAIAAAHDIDAARVRPLTDMEKKHPDLRMQLLVIEVTSSESLRARLMAGNQSPSQLALLAKQPRSSAGSAAPPAAAFIDIVLQLLRLDPALRLTAIGTLRQPILIDFILGLLSRTATSPASSACTLAFARLGCDLHLQAPGAGAAAAGHAPETDSESLDSLREQMCRVLPRHVLDAAAAAFVGRGRRTARGQALADEYTENMANVNKAVAEADVARHYRVIDIRGDAPPGTKNDAASRKHFIRNHGAERAAESRRRDSSALPKPPVPPHRVARRSKPSLGLAGGKAEPGSGGGGPGSARPAAGVRSGAGARMLPGRAPPVGRDARELQVRGCSEGVLQQPSTPPHHSPPCLHCSLAPWRHALMRLGSSRGQALRRGATRLGSVVASLVLRSWRSDQRTWAEVWAPHASTAPEQRCRRSFGKSSR